jgi:hypothetical protein
MVMVPESRPDLCAHRETVPLPIAEIARQLVGLNGRKLTASVGGLPGVRRRRPVDAWRRAVRCCRTERLRFAFQLVRRLAEREVPTAIQSWLTGSNPES